MTDRRISRNLLQTSLRYKADKAQERYTTDLWRFVDAALIALGLAGLCDQKEEITQLSLDFSTAIPASLAPSSESRVAKIIQAERPSAGF